jgi:four helix bundle protein
MDTNNEQIKNHRDLITWQKGIKLVTAIYQAPRSFPREEIYGLTSQMRRAAVSIPANVAEGQGRRTSGEFIQFLGIARGSLYELDTHLEIAVSMDYVLSESAQHLQAQIQEVTRLVNGLLCSLEAKA